MRMWWHFCARPSRCRLGRDRDTAADCVGMRTLHTRQNANVILEAAMVRIAGAVLAFAGGGRGLPCVQRCGAECAP